MYDFWMKCSIPERIVCAWMKRLYASRIEAKNRIANRSIKFENIEIEMQLNKTHTVLFIFVCLSSVWFFDWSSRKQYCVSMTHVACFCGCDDSSAHSHHHCRMIKPNDNSKKSKIVERYSNYVTFVLVSMIYGQRWPFRAPILFFIVRVYFVTSRNKTHEKQKCVSWNWNCCAYKIVVVIFVHN